MATVTISKVESKNANNLLWPSQPQTQNQPLRSRNACAVCIEHKFGG